MSRRLGRKRRIADDEPEPEATPKKSFNFAEWRAQKEPATEHKRRNKSGSFAPFAEGRLEADIPVYQKDGEGKQKGMPTTNMYIKVMSSYEDRSLFKMQTCNEILLDGQTCVWHGENPKDKFNKVRVLSPEQMVMWSEALNKLPNTTVPMWDLAEAKRLFNERAGKHLFVDLIPVKRTGVHPEKVDWLLTGDVSGGNLWPIKTRLAVECGQGITDAWMAVKNFQGEEMNGYVQPGENIDVPKVVKFLEKWGYIVNVYEEAI
mmetsp:Transcript_17918/g.29884  ORF Transcript_17918/g.29884 Transcript_17918/m.29884 type:complete len:261 (-) Transcript_17918:270-1052(-)